MYQFKIRPGSFCEIKNRLLLRTMIISIIAVITGIYISLINTDDETPKLMVFSVSILLSMLAIGYSVNRGLRRYETVFQSFTLLVGENKVVRRQLGVPNVIIYANEVSKVERKKNGNIVIKGTRRAQVIAIPAQIENYEGLEQLLSQMKVFK
jgi:hypothetical protein